MRYHWGLGVGHIHAHRPASIPDRPRNVEDDQNGDYEPDNVSEDVSSIDCSTSDSCDSDKPEWDGDNSDLECWEDEETDGGNDVDCRSELGSESENSDAVGM
jgi:hypothetical protein